jgi:arginase family enzyme
MSSAGDAYELGTLFGLPREWGSDEPRAVVLGVPFDTGRNAYRVGSRLGPDHIRSTCPPGRRHLLELPGDFLSTLRAVDWGNVATVPGDVERSHAMIRTAVDRVHEIGAVPVTMGGDGSVTLPQLRAAAHRHGPLAVVHCDAHTDSYDIDGTGPYTTSTTFLRAQEEGVIEPALTFHVGARGTLSSPDGQPQQIRSLGHNVITMSELHATSPLEVAEVIRAEIADRPTYLCWDMDFFDPSVAPGVATPEWGGASAAVGLTLLRALGGLRLVAIDVNTVSPPHDVQGLTGTLAGRVLLEAMCLIDWHDQHN